MAVKSVLDESTTSKNAGILDGIGLVGAIVTFVGTLQWICGSLRDNGTRRDTVNALKLSLQRLLTREPTLFATSHSDTDHIVVKNSLMHLNAVARKLGDSVSSRSKVKRAANQLFSWNNFDEQTKKLRNGVDDIYRLLDLRRVEQTVNCTTRDFGATAAIIGAVSASVAILGILRRVGQNLADNEGRIATVELLVACLEKLNRLRRIIPPRLHDHDVVANLLGRLEQTASKLHQKVLSSFTRRAVCQLVSWPSFDDESQNLRDGIDDVKRLLQLDNNDHGVQNLSTHQNYVIHTVPQNFSQYVNGPLGYPPAPQSYGEVPGTPCYTAQHAAPPSYGGVPGTPCYTAQHAAPSSYGGVPGTVYYAAQQPAPPSYGGVPGTLYYAAQQPAPPSYGGVPGTLYYAAQQPAPPSYGGVPETLYYAAQQPAPPSCYGGVPGTPYYAAQHVVFQSVGQPPVPPAVPY